LYFVFSGKQKKEKEEEKLAGISMEEGSKKARKNLGEVVVCVFCPSG
jgi:hypothetical protein